MPGPPPDLSTLTAREKETLRLLLDGHDAKSAARALDLSVHTVNERLRDARRKLSVSSSKEAARLLRQAEAAPENAPENVGHKPFGDAAPASSHHSSGQPGIEARSRRPAIWVIGGFAMLTAAAALLALATPAATPPSPAAQTAAPVVETAVTKAARDFLALVDAGNWTESWAVTGEAFRSLNTAAAWEAASQRARAPLGRVLSRRLASEEDVPTPPQGNRIVRFRTDFANKPAATETLSLNEEGGVWKVVGIYIE